MWLISPCSYNKMLAWSDVVLELVVERLYFLVPDLLDILGNLAPNLKVRTSALRSPGSSIFFGRR